MGIVKGGHEQKALPVVTRHPRVQPLSQTRTKILDATLADQDIMWF